MRIVSIIIFLLYSQPEVVFLSTPHISHYVFLLPAPPMSLGKLKSTMVFLPYLVFFLEIQIEFLEPAALLL